MCFKEFSKFGAQSKAVPQLVRAEELSSIFSIVAKQKQVDPLRANDDEENQGLDSQKNTLPRQQYLTLYGFKQALVRMAVYGHETLGGQNEEQLIYISNLEDQRREKQEKLKERVKRREADTKRLTDEVLADMREDWA